MSRVEVLSDKRKRLQFGSLGIHATLPANAVPLRHEQIIKISVITDVSKYVKRSENELFVAFGIQCLPDGLQLTAPINVTIPHCFLVADGDEVIPVLYSGDGEICNAAITPSRRGGASGEGGGPYDFFCQLSGRSWP